MTAKYSPAQKSRKAGHRPAKPSSDFPLYPHPLGYWSKKINKKTLHFGRWGRVVKGKLVLLPPDEFEAGWKAAEAAYNARKVDAHAGKITEFVVQPDAPKAEDGRIVLGELCDRFLHAKRRKMNAGEIGSRMYEEYKAITDLLIKEFKNHKAVDDLAAADFESLRDVMAKQWGPVRLGNAIVRVKSVFKYGYEAGWLERPMRYGPQFVKPSAAVMRKHHNKNGKKMLEAAACRKLLAALDGQEVERPNKKTGEPEKFKRDPNPQLRAMVLLGLNCGFGNHDSAMLTLDVLDLEKGWINFPRPKTGTDRRCPLWPETVAALKAAIAERPKAKGSDAAEFVFLLPSGRPWLYEGIANPVSVASRNAMKEVRIHRAGIGHYTLRHVFRTVADGARDQVAANLIMGHVDPTMAGVYREQIDDSRLLAVVSHVRTWLFG